MKTHYKLVRDNIPEIIAKGGSTPQFLIVRGEDYIEALKSKLVEEAEEFRAAATREQQIEEMADIYEVIDTLRDILDLNYTELCQAQVKKNIEKGKFRKGYYLQKVFEGKEE
jgi:predicted house-cleaning noncanonical NTP pyrophosphatase (MazG superfamily)